MLLDENDSNHDRGDDEYESHDPQPSMALPATESECRLEHVLIQHRHILALDLLRNIPALFNRSRHDLSHFDESSIEIWIIAMCNQRSQVWKPCLERYGLLITMTVFDSDVKIHSLGLPVLEMAIEAAQCIEYA